jgi:predicted transposase YdaD
VAKTADIGSKRLIGLAPTEWARWLTGDATVEAIDVISGEFEWVSRAEDALIKVRSAVHGDFLIANEIQLHPDKRMPVRMRAYVALAEEHYDLPVYPVVVNILPHGQRAEMATCYHAEFLGFVSHQDFKVINLWEVDATLVFERHLATLLPFVPIMKGGHDEALIKQAARLLRADEDISEMGTFLAFWATFVLSQDVLQKIMRWDMVMLRESPWYQENLQEGVQIGFGQGVQQGVQQGRQHELAETVIQLLVHRFGDVSQDLAVRIRGLELDQLRQMVDVALDAFSLDMVSVFIAALPKRTQSGN